MRDAGTYALLIPLEAGLRLRIGRLGIHHLVPGWYVYAGSALGGLSGRLRHHLGPKGRLHWHIDYLLAEARVGRVWYAVGADRLECAWNQVIGGLPGAGCPVPGFGASDCHCRSHLTYFPSMPPMDLFAEKLGRMGLPPVDPVEMPAAWLKDDPHPDRHRPRSFPRTQASVRGRFGCAWPGRPARPV